MILGNLGSGKTAMIVRLIALDKSQRTIYTNIEMPLQPNVITLQRDMLFSKSVVSTKKDGTPVFDYTLNMEYWKNAKKPCMIVIDEAHNIIDARKHASKINVLMNNWMSLLRRITEDSTGGSELILISQLSNRIDIIARELCTHVRYVICHYEKHCKSCGCAWTENSEMSELLWVCPSCESNDLKKKNFKIEVWHFSDIHNYSFWKDMGMNTFYEHYYITDIEAYFKLYNTLQWSNLITDTY